MPKYKLKVCSIKLVDFDRYPGLLLYFNISLNVITWCKVCGKLMLYVELNFQTGSSWVK